MASTTEGRRKRRKRPGRPPPTHVFTAAEGRKGTEATKAAAKRRQEKLDAAVRSVRHVDLVRWIGCNSQRIYDYAALFTLPIGEARIDVVRVFQALFALLERIAPIWESGEDGDLLVEKLRAEVRVKLADAEKRERDNRLAARELVPKSEKQIALNQMADAVIAVMDEAIVKARVESGEEIATRIEATMTELRERLADRGSTGETA